MSLYCSDQEMQVALDLGLRNFIVDEIILCCYYTHASQPE